MKKLLESRLKSGSPLTVFDSYVYEVKSYVPKEQGEASVSVRKELDQYRDLEDTDILEDRRRRNPLIERGFWAVEWQVRLKILRQLVDWTRKFSFPPSERIRNRLTILLYSGYPSVSTKGPVRESIDSLYSAKKQRPASTVYSCDIEGVKDGSKRHLYRIDREYRQT